MRISIRAGLVAAAVRNRLRSFHHELATGCPIPGVPASSPGWPRRQVETTALLCAAVNGPELSPRGVQLTPPALWALHARRHQVRELTLPCHAHIPSHRLTGFHLAQEAGGTAHPSFHAPHVLRMGKSILAKRPLKCQAAPQSTTPSRSRSVLTHLPPLDLISPTMLMFAHAFETRNVER